MENNLAKKIKGYRESEKNLRTLSKEHQRKFRIFETFLG